MGRQERVLHTPVLAAQRNRTELFYPKEGSYIVKTGHSAKDIQVWEYVTESGEAEPDLLKRRGIDQSVVVLPKDFTGDWRVRPDPVGPNAPAADTILFKHHRSLRMRPSQHMILAPDFLIPASPHGKMDWSSRSISRVSGLIACVSGMDSPVSDLFQRRTVQTLASAMEHVQPNLFRDAELLDILAEIDAVGLAERGKDAK